MSIFDYGEFFVKALQRYRIEMNTIHMMAVDLKGLQMNQERVQPNRGGEQTYTERFIELLKSDYHVQESRIKEYIELTRQWEKFDLFGPQCFYILNLSELAFEAIGKQYGRFLGLKEETDQEVPLPFNFISAEQKEIVVDRLLPEIRKFRDSHSTEDLLDMTFQLAYTIKKGGKSSRVIDQYKILQLAEDKKVVLSYGKLSFIREYQEFQHISASVYHKNADTHEPIFFKNYSPLENRLSQRELQVLTQQVRGNTSSEIGAKLYISENTVNRHKQNMLEKLKIDNPKQLTHYALLNGIF